MLGFDNPKSARSSFYKRAKVSLLCTPSTTSEMYAHTDCTQLLHDYETEPDTFVNAQAALLLTHWRPSQDSGSLRADSLWLSIAIFHAKSIGADDYDRSHSEIRLLESRGPTRTSLKRLWRCCIIRDLIISLCVRRNMQITSSDFDANLHTTLDYENHADDIDYSGVYSLESKQALLQISGLHLDLCQILTNLLQVLNPLWATPRLDRKGLDPQQDELQRQRYALQCWASKARQSMPAANGARRDGLSMIQKSVFVFVDQLWMYY